MKVNQNGELQTRREFFKKAAKAALPVVGAVVLSALPIQQAHASYCQAGYACTGACSGDCKGTCQGYCKGGCKYVSR